MPIPKMSGTGECENRIECPSLALTPTLHSWAQWKLSPLNILLLINCLLLSLGFNGINNLQKFNNQRFQWFKKMLWI